MIVKQKTFDPLFAPIPREINPELGDRGDALPLEEVDPWRTPSPLGTVGEITPEQTRFGHALESSLNSRQRSQRIEQPGQLHGSQAVVSGQGDEYPDLGIADPDRVDRAVG